MWLLDLFMSQPSCLSLRRLKRQRYRSRRLPTVEPLESRALLSFIAAAAYDVGARPEGAVAADFNRDGRLDLAVANGGDNSVSVLLGNGDGSFQAAGRLSAGLGPRAVA